MNKFPIYVVSKGRADSRLTVKALEKMGIDYKIIIEEQEFDQYSAVIDKKHILILDKAFQDDYQTLDDLGNTKSKGPGAARNFAWDHAIKSGAEWHWVMDDNIRSFSRLNNNNYYKVLNPVFFQMIEDFTLRYENVGMSGPNYEMFITRKVKTHPIVLNTRIYSCNFIRNDLPYRWRGRYNEDTILSLDMLRDGWCTIQFNAFLQFKSPTQTVKGGNHDDFYSKEGTRPKSEMLVKAYPEYCKLVYKFSRVHHEVNYRPFKNNKLKRKPEYENITGINNYNLELKKARI